MRRAGGLTRAYRLTQYSNDMAKFDEGRFVARDNYTSDDMEAYALGAIDLLEQSFTAGTFYFQSGYFYTLSGNYASDDLEAEGPGTIPNLHNGQRHGDCLFKTGKFH